MQKKQKKTLTSKQRSNPKKSKHWKRESGGDNKPAKRKKNKDNNFLFLYKTSGSNLKTWILANKQNNKLIIPKKTLKSLKEKKMNNDTLGSKRTWVRERFFSNVTKKEQNCGIRKKKKKLILRYKFKKKILSTQLTWYNLNALILG